MRRSLEPALDARLFDDGIHRVHELGAAAVIDCQVELHPGVLRGGGDGGFQFLPDRGGQGIHATHAGEADAVAHDFGKLAAQINAQQPPQHVNLGARTLPVFGGESIQRQGLDAQPAAGFNGVTNSVDTRGMACGAGQIPLAGPAAVAIHNDGDVRGQAVRIDGFGELPILASGLDGGE